jgi:hypothetical protein
MTMPTAQASAYSDVRREDVIDSVDVQLDAGISLQLMGSIV